MFRFVNLDDNDIVMDKRNSARRRRKILRILEHIYKKARLLDAFWRCFLYKNTLQILKISQKSSFFVLKQFFFFKILMPATHSPDGDPEL